MNVKAMTLSKNKFLALLEKYPKIKDEFLENEQRIKEQRIKRLVNNIFYPN